MLGRSSALSVDVNTHYDIRQKLVVSSRGALLHARSLNTSSYHGNNAISAAAAEVANAGSVIITDSVRSVGETAANSNPLLKECSFGRLDESLVSPAMGHWGTCPLDFQLINFSGHFRAEKL